MSESVKPEPEKAPEVAPLAEGNDSASVPTPAVPLGESASAPSNPVAPTPDATTVPPPAVKSDTPAESPAAPIVDWEKALEQVGGDMAFLFEVINDFFEEAQPALADLNGGIADGNFEKIMHSSHKIKGSASFVYCEHIKLKAAELQMLGRKGTETSEGSEERLETIKKDTAKLHQIFEETKAEIAKYKQEHS